MKVFITRCHTIACPSRFTCLRSQIVRRKQEQVFNYEQERKTNMQCSAYIRFRPEIVKFCY